MRMSSVSKKITLFSGLFPNNSLHGDLRRKAVRQRMSGASSTQVLPRSTGCPERRSGSGKSGKFWIQKVCWRKVLERC